MEWLILMAPVPATVEFVVPRVPALLLACFVAIVPVLLAVRAALARENASPSSVRLGALDCLRRAHLGQLERLERILGNQTIT